MSDVKIVFSNIVGGSGVANQIRSLVNQLNDDCVLSIGGISVCVDSFDHARAVTAHSVHDCTSYYELTVYGRVMETTMDQPKKVSNHVRR